MLTNDRQILIVNENNMESMKKNAWNQEMKAIPKFVWEEACNFLYLNIL